MIMTVAGAQTQHHSVLLWREWNGKVTQIFIPSSLHFISCQVYSQEAISIYKVDFNLSIDLCFQDVLRKLVSQDGEFFLAIKCPIFCVYKKTASCKKQ